MYLCLFVCRGNLRLTVGSALGQISELFAKVRSINAKHGKFDLVLCLGDFFGPVKDGEGELCPDAAALLNGRLEGAPRALLD
jgi:hypothetical protein